MKKQAIHIVKTVVIKDGKPMIETEEREVRVMAIAEGYAMVRRKRAMPYVCSLKDLKPRAHHEGDE